MQRPPIQERSRMLISRDDHLYIHLQIDRHASGSSEYSNVQKEYVDMQT